MPIEIRELVIKASVALDWENKTATEAEEQIVCLRMPDEKQIAIYVKKYFKQYKSKCLSFDQPSLVAFLSEWQASLLK